MSVTKRQTVQGDRDLHLSQAVSVAAKREPEQRLQISVGLVDVLLCATFILCNGRERMFLLRDEAACDWL